MCKLSFCIIIILVLGGLVGTAWSQRKLSGLVEKVPQSGTVGEWVISSQTVQVTTDTKLGLKHGPAAMGAYVETKGVHFQGKYVAYEIEVKKFYGTVEKLPSDGFEGEWVIAGQKFQVTPGTQLDFKHGPVAKGTQVKVESELVQGQYQAKEIETKGGR